MKSGFALVAASAVRSAFARAPYAKIVVVSGTPYCVDSNNNVIALSGTAAASPYAHLTKSGTQNVGGSNGTVTYINWDGTQINVDTGFTHSTSTNPSRVQVDADGRYEVKAAVGVTQGGGSRTTIMSSFRVNGSTSIVRGRQRNYSRGANYGDMSLLHNTELDLSDGDYIEFAVTVDDTDSAYTNNTINAECELIIRKVS